MSSHLVDALENFATLGARRGVGEVLVLHVVRELGKLFLAIGTHAGTVDKTSCDKMRDFYSTPIILYIRGFL